MQFLVFASPTVGKEDEFNEWYTGEHIPDMLKIPAVTSATRIRLRPVGGTEKRPEYLTTYEVDGDIDSLIKEIGVRTRNGDFGATSDTLDMSSVRMIAGEPA
ncbi:DUF4286 family protein [Nocardia sp. alder85J]|uniref:DUF4286 family protein n=1 Tax=Nocardia sp. alder85J TaxID=2862949 RepID=UPI001CD601CE|nr:DUF4286 family protein [Nocardia sp. alder85J]MCX4090818.1 hypothetical protein [Nocardia sp. alder85J]